ncbi:hypothetical protein HN014_10505 [Aquimarina sp. TRL1]|uniref:cell division protein FtsQ/DivIB n=1 Tax=Aquimarina sp. (strain TRL1) TaxID=2736252 RepID=UPI00158D8768|nr:cell division protein FtsQ/DivIB [Aquimarina sp. TRL1]QKX05330.1 hypothetical protein HN014_10505 [Aquimarina sp. TRL1]
MKKLLGYIKFGVLFLLIVLLYAFTTARNHERKIEEIKVEFIEEQSPYVNETMVNKLLIQNQNRATSVGKEILALNKVEKQLDQHEMIQNSDVYLSVDGKLKVSIRQRTPIARVDAVTPFYVDTKGEIMPLSNNYSAHVPLVYNVSEREVSEIFPLLKEIREDEFLKKHVVSVYRNRQGNYELGFRVYAFKVNFGKAENLKSKVSNFKAFYKKAIKDKNLKEYRTISLQFRNQVVCTKK